MIRCQLKVEIVKPEDNEGDKIWKIYFKCGLQRKWSKKFHPRRITECKTVMI